jgi:uncharacterized protein YaiE (UPF0345 family)
MGVNFYFTGVVLSIKVEMLYSIGVVLSNTITFLRDNNTMPVKYISTTLIDKTTPVK